MEHYFPIPTHLIQDRGGCPKSDCKFCIAKGSSLSHLPFDTLLGLECHYSNLHITPCSIMDYILLRSGMELTTSISPQNKMCVYVCV